MRALLAHLVSGNVSSKAVAEGEPPRRAGTPTGILGDDPAASYHRSAQEMAKAWREPGRLERTYWLPFGELPGEAAVAMHLLETVVHGWE